MKPFAVNSLLLLLAVSLLTACGKDPRDRLLGKWKVSPQATRGGGPEATELAMRVEIKDDGTFVLTGSPIFEGLAGVREVKGTYDFRGDDRIHVKMKTRAFDYEPTTYSITTISRSELILNTGDHSVTLRRDD